jgi:plasmid stabilization system protein ParE
MAAGKRRFEEPLEYEIVIYEDARRDIIEIAKWYDLQAVGLGGKFENYLGKTIERLTTHPKAFGFLYKDVRKILVDKFPYLIFYRIKEHVVHIYGVMHTKRKPATYKKRLKDI